MDGRWKLLFPHTYRTMASGSIDGQPGLYRFPEGDTQLFDSLHDPYEKTSVIQACPKIAQELISLAVDHKTKFYPE